MLISLTTSKKGETQKCAAAVNPRYITSVVFVPEFGLTAVNIYNGCTLWAHESPREIQQDIYEVEKNG